MGWSINNYCLYFNKTWKEASTQRSLPNLCFSGKSLRKRWPLIQLILPYWSMDFNETSQEWSAWCPLRSSRFTAIKRALKRPLETFDDENGKLWIDPLLFISWFYSTWQVLDETYLSWTIYLNLPSHPFTGLCNK